MEKSVAFILKTPDIPLEHGTHNGYVAVPPKNKYHGVHYNDYPTNELIVHGGITYAEYATIGKQTFGSNRRVNDKYIGKRNPILTNAEFITENTEIGDDWFIIGFDTCHFGDNSEDWCKEEVIKETLDLLRQVEDEE